MDGKPVFFKEWFSKGVVSVKDLLNKSGQYLSFQEFISKYHCKASFLQYYQILSCIANHLLNKARDALFQLDRDTEIDLAKLNQRISIAY